MQQSVSRSAIILSAVVVVGLVALLFWWRTAPQGDGRSYSDAVSKLESSPEFEAREKAKAAGVPVAEPSIPDDKAYQPEDR